MFMDQTVRLPGLFETEWFAPVEYVFTLGIIR